MLKKTFILVLTGILIFSSLAVLASVVPASAPYQNMYPASSPAGNYHGNVTVLPDGSLVGTGAGQLPLIQVSTSVFSLTGNINGTLSDQMNGSTINGNGFTVNGGPHAAILAGNVTGITIENLAIVNISQSNDGIQLYRVYNSVVDNVAINNTNEVSMTMIWVYYSGNVTIENSHFQLGLTATSSYGIDAEYDSAVNVSFNTFTGVISYYYSLLYCNSVSQLNAWGNTVNSNAGYGFNFNGGNAVFANNYFNDTDDAIEVDGAQAITSMNNYISNSSDGFDIYYISTFTSYNDSAIFCNGQSLYVYAFGSAIIENGNFSNSTSYIEFEQGEYVSVANSTISSTSSSDAIYEEQGTTLNLYNDQIIDDASSSFAVGGDDMAGWVNLANDYLYAPNGEGLNLIDSPQFNATDSLFNATTGINVENSAIIGATVSGNMFVNPTMDNAVYMYTDSDAYNINIVNNTVQSPNSSWGENGISVETDYLSSNITVSGNTITNNDCPIYLYGSTGGVVSNAIIQNNTIVNSKEAIYDDGCFNINITGNKIINVSDVGIGAVANEYPGVDVSNNLIENLPGFGGMNYSIEVEDFCGGNNIVSHNTVLNPGSNADDIYVDDCYPVLVYSNNVNDGEYGFYLADNEQISFFNNTVSNTDYGIDSYVNSNIAYYSNTVDNANYSLYSDGDNGYVFANTFSDSQANNPALYFLYVYNDPITFYHNNFINDTTNSTTYNYFTGTNGPLFMNDPLPTGGNYWSNYTGTGTNGIGNSPMNVTGTIQDIYPLTSKWTAPTVTFIENGLASGTSWSASMGGTQKSSTGNTIVFSESNGQYMNVGYGICSVAGYTVSATSGSVYLNGASSTVTVTFTPLQYKMTFTESGLQSNTTWSVTLNGKTETSSTGSITLNLANGTYDYSLGLVNGYHLSSTTGTFTVNGNQQTISVNFVPNTYNLTVFETGLPSGDYWNFTLNGQNYSTNSTTLTIQVTAGNYSYNVSGPLGYTVTPPSSNFTVNGSNLTLFIHFSAQKVTPAVASGTGKVLEGLGIGVLITAVVGIMGSFLITGKFPWDLIKKK